MFFLAKKNLCSFSNNVINLLASSEDYEMPNFDTVGIRYRGFRVTKAIAIEELQCTLHELTHQASGAQILHIANDDPENLFCLSFRTVPDSSDGVAHILEHTVLCGSEKYPVKDPFFAMNRRSLNTFMNALTGSDFTCYPAASQVPKDFYNLMEVYLDAVFHPFLKKFSFLQEGHRLEFADASDPSTPLTYKGVVFNEMKGALNSPDSRLIEAINSSLYPDITYGVNSGGDPKVIPQLTYNKLKHFHTKYYHPSHCLFFFYGNMPLEGHLNFLLKHALRNVKRAVPLSPIPHQQRLKKPIVKREVYPVAPDEDATGKTIVAHAWLTCHILQQQELLALTLIETILMCTDASPLKYALLSSGYCKQAGAYIDEEVSEIPFVLIMKGCKHQHASKLKKVITNTLKKMTKEGIPERLIDSALHQLEFQRSEITGDHTPFGLSLFMRSALLRQHGGQPEDGLVIHSLFDALRKKINEDPQYLTGLINKHLINNPHHVTVMMVPDKKLGAKESAEERVLLKKIRANLSKRRVKEIVTTAAQLAAFQKEQEDQDLEVLPKVTLADVPLKSRHYPLSHDKVDDIEIFHHDCFTNNIVYMDWVYDFPKIKPEDLPMVRLFTVLLPQMGCGGRDYITNLEYIQENTGGVGMSLALNIQATDHTLFQPTIHLRGKALSRKVDKLFPLIGDMVSSADFTDIPRLKEVLLKHHTALESALNANALRYAINLSASAHSIPSAIGNLWYGLEYLWLIRDLIQHLDKRCGDIITKMQYLQKHLLGLQGAHLVLSCDRSQYRKMHKEAFWGLLEAPSKKYSPWKSTLKLPGVASQGRIIASPVAFIAKALPSVSYCHPLAPALSLAACIFDKKTLHPRIREQGGAYGSGAVSNTSSGQFYFYSFRDPNISNTFNAFADAVNNLADGNFTDTDLQEAKLEIIASLDSPIAPGNRADAAYGWWREGKTLKRRQAFRNRMLKLTAKEVVKATQQHILAHIDRGKNVVFSSKDLLEKENSILIEKGLKPLKIKNI